MATLGKYPTLESKHKSLLECNIIIGKSKCMHSKRRSVDCTYI